MDLTEAEDIKKRWQEYTEELYKKDLHDPDNYGGVWKEQEEPMRRTPKGQTTGREELGRCVKEVRGWRESPAGGDS